MGLLDDYYSQAGLGPWGAFYPSPLQATDDPAAAVPLPMPRPAAADQPAQAAAPAPDSYMPIGTYQMPQFGSQPPSASTANGAASGTVPNAPVASDSVPGLGDRLSASLASIAHSKGLIPSMVNGAAAFASGARTDPDAVSDNLTVRALQARGVSAADAQAALGNPAIMRALIGQYYGAAAQRPANAGSARPAAAAGGGDTDPSAQGGAPSSAPAAVATPPALTLPARPRLQPGPVRGAAWRALR